MFVFLNIPPTDNAHGTDDNFPEGIGEVAAGDGCSRGGLWARVSIWFERWGSGPGSGRLSGILCCDSVVVAGHSMGFGGTAPRVIPMRKYPMPRAGPTSLLLWNTGVILVVKTSLYQTKRRHLLRHAYWTVFAVTACAWHVIRTNLCIKPGLNPCWPYCNTFRECIVTWHISSCLAQDNITLGPNMSQFVHHHTSCTPCIIPSPQIVVWRNKFDLRPMTTGTKSRISEIFFLRRFQRETSNQTSFYQNLFIVFPRAFHRSWSFIQGMSTIISRGSKNSQSFKRVAQFLTKWERLPVLGQASECFKILIPRKLIEVILL